MTGSAGTFVLLTALPFPQAQLLRGALEAEGVEVRIQREALSSVYGLDAGEFATQVRVRAEDFEHAQALLAEFEAGPELGDDDPQD